jgi:O-antigen ligase
MRQLETGSRTASLLLLAGALLVPLASGLTAGSVSLPLKAVILAVLAVTLWRPGDGLLVVAGLAPVAGLLLPMGRVPPIRLAEAFVMAFLCGWLLRRAVSERRADRPAVQLPVVLFAVVVLASCAVELATLQIATDYPGAFVQRAWTFVKRVFLLPSGDFPSLTAGALLLEGVGLLAAARTLAADDRTLARRLLTVTVFAGVAIAALNIATLAAGSLAGGHGGPVRITVHVPDFNAAGSYLVMVLPMALAVLVAERRWSLTAVVAVLVGAALWLTGSRAAVAAGGGLVMIAIVWQTLRHRIAASRGLAVAIVAAAIVITGVIAVAPRVVVREDSASRALDIRMEFLATSLRMMATGPLFGVGIGQYYNSSGAFMSPRLRAIYPVENAHNNFMQIGAELGLVGLALFVWVLGAVLARVWKEARSRLDDPVPFGVFAGLGAFLLTCLTGHPLLVREVAYPFWVTLGIAAAIGAASQPHRLSGTSVRRRYSAIAGVVVVLASVPFRVASEARATDLSNVTYGLRQPERSRAGVTFRRMNGEATFFVRAGVRLVELPLAIADSSPGEATEVEIALDGRPANRVRVEAGNWTRARVLIPHTSAERPFRRLDLHVVCPGSAGSQQACPGLHDERLVTGTITTY